MPARVTVKGISGIKNQLNAAKREIIDAANQGMLRIAEKTVDTLKETTPRSDRSVDQHTADLWELKVVSGEGGKGRGGFLAVVDHPFNEPGATQTETIETGASRTRIVNDGDFNLLEGLEYGTTAHKILPREAEQLVFRAADGALVFTGEVDHPGTAPVGMVRQAAAEAGRDIGVLLATVAAKLRSL